MTKYRVDRIITSAYTGPLAKRHCAMLRHALTLTWMVMTLPNALDAFRPNHFVLLVDRCAASGPNVELCGSDHTDDYDDSSEADDEQLASAVIWRSDKHVIIIVTRSTLYLLSSRRGNYAVHAVFSQTPPYTVCCKVSALFQRSKFT